MKKLYERVCAVEAVAAAVLLMLMVILIFLGGVMRMLGHPINWSVDAATCFFAWGAFLCADIAWRNNALMSIEVVVERLPQKLQKLCLYLNYAIITIFLIYVLIGGQIAGIAPPAQTAQGVRLGEQTLRRFTQHPDIVVEQK